MTKKPSICYDCKNARADLCEKIHFGNFIKGSTVDCGIDGNTVVTYCPNFKHDLGVRLLQKEIAEIFKIKPCTVNAYGSRKILHRLKNKGINAYVTYVNGRRYFYLK